MNGFQIFKYYTGIKTHFTTKNYDYWIYNKKSRTSFDKYESRNDKKFFMLLANRMNNKNMVLHYMVAQFKNGANHISECVGDYAVENYNKHLSDISSLHYNLQNDLKLIESNDINSGSIIKKIGKSIKLESVCLIDIVKDIFQEYDKTNNSLLYIKKGTFLKKYRSYLQNTVNKEVLNKIKIILGENLCQV